MALTPSSITVELHVIVVEHGTMHDDVDPEVFVGELEVVNRQALTYLRDLHPEMIHDQGEEVLAPLRSGSGGDPVEQLDDDAVTHVLEQFHEASTAPWLTTFVREITIDVTVAR